MIKLIGPYFAKLQGQLFSIPGNRSELKVFETEVGVKYKNGAFNSAHFDRYVIRKISLTSLSVSFSSLLLPPDLLRNQNTLCGVRLPHSPHFHLMAAIESSKSIRESEYLQRCQRGTIDARLPAKRNLNSLVRRYHIQRAELCETGTSTISVIQVSWHGEPVYVIADGKHRAALAACLNRPESICLQLLSADFAQDAFFQTVYSFVLNLDAHDYSINQQMIRTILGEHQP